jgi:ABC-type proline/glycine betaine transport system permease subunit
MITLIPTLIFALIAVTIGLPIGLVSTRERKEYSL